MTVTLVEARESGSATVAEATAGRVRIALITPGWGSSGYYSAEALEQAARDRIWPTGTHMYLDHPTLTEQVERPARSVRDLAAVLTSDAVWDGNALVAEARVFTAHREWVLEAKDAIGVSIRAGADVVYGEAEGRTGRIISRITEGLSVDFVTKPGRGGRILAAESARVIAEARTLGQWVESRIHRDFTVMADGLAGDGRLTREERITLSGGIGDALAAFVARVEADAPQLYARDLYDEPGAQNAAASEAATVNDTRDALNRALAERFGGEDSWAYVQNFNDTTVWYEHGGPEGYATFALGYSVNDDAAVALTGEPTEVRAVTTYVPVDPAGRSNPEESEEDTMPQIEEARLRQLEEAEGRVGALESERDTAVERATAAEARATSAERTVAEANARTDAATRARARVVEANGNLPTSTVDRIVATATATVPLTEAGTLDVTALEAAVDTARTAEEAYLASLAEANGAGTPSGLPGTTPPAGQVSEAELDKTIAGAFGRTVKGA